jgi:alkanesulfonate monooxygenase SsuD/methylene tetrahydromethanopterin reductase-like flavin-dependent oxidoreductase (luciferase family)
MLDQAVERAGRPAGSVKLAAFTHFHVLQTGLVLADAIADGFGTAPLVACVDNRVVLRANALRLGQELVDDVEAAIAISHIARKGDPMTDHLERFKAFGRNRDTELRAAITERIARTFTVYGTADECLAQVRLMEDAGVDMLAVAFLSPVNFDRDTDAFADAVIRRW